MEASCLQLSIEGERLLKAHDYQGAIEFFEAGLRQGTDDPEVLSAVYNQLGNACFYLNQYEKALEYHKKDLEIAERLNDKQGQAKAFGNLGNTFKSLKNYPNAIRCCEAHLELTRELKDRLGEGRACYNLGNVHHAVGKRELADKNPASQEAGRASIMKAIDYYKTTLEITAEQKDKAGEGRAVGNLGNAYTAIGNYKDAIEFHNRRLRLAEEANDLAARARACGNLGNAYSALSDYTQALQFYNQSLTIAKEARNRAGEGQAYYCLGSTYMLQKNYEKAIANHHEHLKIVTELKDKSGQMRAWYNLRNAYHAVKNEEQVKKYHTLIRQHQPKKAAAQPAKPEVRTQSGASTNSGNSSKAAKDKSKKKKAGGLFKKPASNVVEEFTVDDSDDDDVVTTRATNDSTSGSKQKKSFASEWLDKAVEESKNEFKAQEATRSKTGPAVPAQQEDLGGIQLDFFDMLAKQQARMDDQRAPAPSGAVGASEVEDDEAFFDMLIMTQGHRYDDQRSSAPSDAAERNVAPKGKDDGNVKAGTLADELDDDMSFFEMLAVARKTK
eukprot:TRINITY_DN9578_c0_g1_i3.p1 TRINITY_DN9578_c0_g1~~TRINITY_DN9578_c0_g1_i3.p1  ORF type:complete len:556 (+),score=212.88 TRINITY_DN9578_c0_g1_i3:239-1906(+)